MAFDWNRLTKFENWHCRSHVTPLIGGFCPPPPQKNIPPTSTNPNQILIHDF